jgi:hypothetical protein
MKSYPDIIKQFLVHQKPYYIEVGNEITSKRATSAKSFTAHSTRKSHCCSRGRRAAARPVSSKAWLTNSNCRKLIGLIGVCPCRLNMFVLRKQLFMPIFSL